MSAGAATATRLRSNPCRQAQLQSDTFQAWAVRLGERPGRMHRKIWEYCYIAQALDERGMLAPGRRGLGFAVGQEPLSALFASRGCEIVATDIATDAARNAGWVHTGQHADSLADLNARGLCDPEQFRRRVSFRFVDMRSIPDDLGDYDFVWSSCSFEHLGSIPRGLRFVRESSRLIREGGVGVHTTEYNVSSNLVTIGSGPTVLFRRRDLEGLGRDLGRLGFRLDLDFARGDLPLDRAVDRAPYSQDNHLNLRLRWFVATSFGLILERDGAL